MDWRSVGSVVVHAARFSSRRGARYIAQNACTARIAAAIPDRHNDHCERPSLAEHRFRSKKQPVLRPRAHANGRARAPKTRHHSHKLALPALSAVRASQREHSAVPSVEGAAFYTTKSSCEELSRRGPRPGLRFLQLSLGSTDRARPTPRGLRQAAPDARRRGAPKVDAARLKTGPRTRRRHRRRIE